MLTVQMLTKNNEKTILDTFESMAVFKPRFLVGDYGSTDNTLNICKRFDAEVLRFKGMPRNEARNCLAEKNKEGWNLWVEPWENVLQNFQSYQKINDDKAYVRVINGNIVTWELRLWKNKTTFINPVFENIDSNSGVSSPMILSSQGGLILDESIEILNEWKISDPISNKPYYYQACVYLAQGKYEEFMKIADHYLFLDKSISMSTTMTRYYQALVYLSHYKSVKNSLKNLNLCLCVKPLMAEFWCLTGDVYYHLLHKFEMAKEFYENALVLGQRRLNSDRWPMDISKYGKYPNMMIESCNKILKNNSDYVPV